MLKKQAFTNLNLLKISVAAASLFLLIPLKPVCAETVLDKVAKTGIFTAGTSKDSFPFAYADDNRQLSGYSVDMIKLIKVQLEKTLKRPVRLKLVALTPEERIAKLQSGDIDIVCDSASFTWERDQLIDFSSSYGFTGTRLMVKRGTALPGPESLVGKRIGVLPKTTNEDSIRRVQPKAQIVLFKDSTEGYKALQEGKIDGFAGDGLLLKGWLKKTANTENFQVENYAYSKEGIACMVPENNSKLLDKTNYALLSFMQGVVQNKPSSMAIFDKWFGPNSFIPLNPDMKAVVTQKFQGILEVREAVPENAP
jgi:polar amino acid transport system substrate-binding protein